MSAVNAFSMHKLSLVYVFVVLSVVVLFVVAVLGPREVNPVLLNELNETVRVATPRSHTASTTSSPCQ